MGFCSSIQQRPTKKHSGVSAAGKATLDFYRNAASNDWTISGRNAEGGQNESRYHNNYGGVSSYLGKLVAREQRETRFPSDFLQACGGNGAPVPRDIARSVRHVITAAPWATYR